jgi:CheY-like chemotaxis protein
MTQTLDESGTPTPPEQTVLVVDDHDATRCVMLRLLHRAGHSAVGVSSGEEALSWMRQRRPALVILDVMMPNLDGLATLRRLRQNKDLDAVPVMMYTAAFNDEMERQAKELGAVGCLRKAKSWDIVMREIGRAVRPEARVND